MVDNWRTALASLAVNAVMLAFDTEIVYTPAGESPVTFKAVFDEAYIEQTFDTDGTPVDATWPVIDVKLSDIPVDPAQDDTLTIGARSFQVKTIERGGQGLSSKLYLVETT